MTGSVLPRDVPRSWAPMIGKNIDQSAPFALTFVWDRRTVAQTRRSRLACDQFPAPDHTHARVGHGRGWLAGILPAFSLFLIPIPFTALAWQRGVA